VGAAWISSDRLLWDAVHCCVPEVPESQQVELHDTSVECGPARIAQRLASVMITPAMQSAELAERLQARQDENGSP